MTIHILKSDTQPFRAVLSGRKLCEVQINESERKDLRDTGYYMYTEVTHFQRSYGLPDDMVVMSIKVISRGANA